MGRLSLLRTLAGALFPGLPTPDALCWSGEYTEAACCSVPPKRSDCWWGVFTRELCCVPKQESAEEEKSRRKLGQDLLRGVQEVGQGLLTGAMAECLDAELRFESNLRGQDLTVFYHYLDMWKSRHALLRRAECTDGDASVREGLTILQLYLFGVVGDMAGVEYEYIKAAGKFYAEVLRRSRHRYAQRARVSHQRADVGLQEPQRVAWTAPAAEAVHIAMVASIGSPPFGRKALAGIRSALFFAQERPLHFHLFVDAQGHADVRAALSTLEPWLYARGHFQLYGDGALRRAWALIRRLVPRDCRSHSTHYGSAGFLRLLVHEIVRQSEVRALVFVDAGDYVFLEDPARLLDHHRRFSASQVAAAPVSHPLPFQLFDLPGPRRWVRLSKKATETEVPHSAIWGKGLHSNR